MLTWNWNEREPTLRCFPGPPLCHFRKARTRRHRPVKAHLEGGGAGGCMATASSSLVVQVSPLGAIRAAVGCAGLDARQSEGAAAASRLVNDAFRIEVQLHLQ